MNRGSERVAASDGPCTRLSERRTNHAAAA